jgi:hypothetical protein
MFMAVLMIVLIGKEILFTLGKKKYFLVDFGGFSPMVNL